MKKRELLEMLVDYAVKNITVEKISQTIGKCSAYTCRPGHRGAIKGAAVVLAGLSAGIYIFANEAGK